jgi:hypothetical protein
VFPTVHLYPSGENEVSVVVTPEPAAADSMLAARAEALQRRHGFRFALPDLLKRRVEHPSMTRAELLTDDFAPVNYYDQIGRSDRRKKE